MCRKSNFRKDPLTVQKEKILSNRSKSHGVGGVS